MTPLAAPGALARIDGLAGLNELFAAWVETVYHHRVHSETGQPPLQRFLVDHVTATNNGPSDASKLLVKETFTLPPGVTVESVAPSGLPSSWVRGSCSS